MRGSAVCLADLVRSTVALNPQGRALEALLKMLHLAPLEEKGPKPPGEGWSWESPDDEEERAGGPSGPSATFDVTPEDLVGLEKLAPSKLGQPVTAPADPLPQREDRHLRPRLPYRALLAERTETELATVAASSPVATSEIDVNSAVFEIAHGRPVREIPLLVAPSIAPGTQILVDIGESMQPFRRDQKMLLRRFRDLAGRSADVRYYVDDPRAGAGPTQRRSTWKTYSLPDPGRPVIVLTDLGCGIPRRPDAVNAWIALSRRLHGRRSSIVAFAPLPRERLDRRLRRLVSLVEWDDRTTRVGALRLRQELE